MTFLKCLFLEKPEQAKEEKSALFTFGEFVLENVGEGTLPHYGTTRFLRLYHFVLCYNTVTIFAFN